MHTKTRVMDSVMGSGKTTRIIDQINKHPERHFIIIVERQTEVDRLAAACPNLISLSEVSEELNIKRLDALELVASEGKSIVSTHQLFKRWSDNFISSVINWGYELIMDETLSDILTEVSINSGDLHTFVNEKFIVCCGGNELNKIKELKSLPTKYSEVSRKISNCDCYLFDMRNKEDDPNYLLIEAPQAEIFKSFKSILVLTYQFKGSLLRCYFDLHHIKYEMRSIQNGEITSYHDGLGKIFQGKIRIYDDKYNHQNGKDIGSLTWIKKPVNQKATKKRLRNVYNYWEQYGVCPNNFLYTVHKDYRNAVLPQQNGLSKKLNERYLDNKLRNDMSLEEKKNVCFLAHTARGINDFSHKKFMAYTPNTFMNRQIRNFLIHHDVQIDEDAYALNRMIQWLWRGCIRNDEEMHVFVPSKRMRQLLVDWLDGKPISA
jgi:hypothetical protein